MAADLEVFVPALTFDESKEDCVFSRFEPGTRVLPVGFRAHPRFAPLQTEIVLDKDVAVKLRDGVTIYVDVLRPKSAEKVPVIVAWSPYGKSRGHDKRYVELLSLLGMDLSGLSGLMKFEGPDPAYWCAQGYAVCHPDPRGSFNSEGDIHIWSRKEGQDFSDIIEWLGGRDWCNGAVGLTGNSYLAISQWFAAAEQPPHLKAIAPWEGMSDIYRDLTVRGGIPDYPFSERLCANLTGKHQREDFVAEAEAHPLVDALWESKIPEFERINVPAYVVASYSNSIHTQGTFRGWRRMASTNKWLRIHNTMEWPDYYEQANVDDLRRFFDRYLKGVDNGWEATPRVRYALMDLAGGDRVNLPADAFPPKDTVTTKLYLDANAGVLSTDSPNAATANYDATSAAGRAVFTLRAQSPTAFVGYPKLRLWVAAEGHDDMDLFVFLEKLNANGERLEQVNVPNSGPQMQAITKNGAAILKYKGSNGRLRVSRRHLDAKLTTDAIPAHSFDRNEKLTPGQVVEVEIDMFPVGLALNPGEQLRLVISGYNEWGGPMPGIDNVSAQNRGRHLIHTGGARASYLQLPMKRLVD
jgi:predicted acyl esterase